MTEEHEHDIYKPLEFNEDGEVLYSGWKPPTEEDYKALETTRGASSIDLEELMAVPARDTYLWPYLHLALKKYHKDPNYVWRPQYQKYGTCVGQASKLAADILMAINSILYGEEFPGRAAVAGSYTFARVEVAGQPGRWEGANGVNAATAFCKFGVLLLKHINLPDDALDADENLAMKWTASRQGVPQIYEDMAQNLLVRDVVAPTSVKMAAKLIQGGSPQFVGTNYIPTGRRNSAGISPVARSRGGHEMCCDGVIYHGEEPYVFHIQNSWNDWGSGGVNPTDMPIGSVWVSAEDYGKMIGQGDVSSIIGTNGLKFVG